MMSHTEISAANRDCSTPDNEAWITCYVGLGSNLTNALGSPIDHLQQALTRLRNHEQIRELQVSSFYASAPMGPQDQPDFINAVAGFKTTLAALELLAYCQTLEQAAMRARLRHWGERSLDVDILLYGQETITLPELTVPHAGISQRNFVLIPLSELAIDITIANQPLATYPIATDWTGLKRLTDA